MPRWPRYNVEMRARTGEAQRKEKSESDQSNALSTGLRVSKNRTSRKIAAPANTVTRNPAIGNALHHMMRANRSECQSFGGAA